MKKILGKKQILLAVLVVALGAAVYLNYHFSMKDPLAAQTGTKPTTAGTTKNLGDSQYVSGTTAAPADSNDYFVKARQNREKAREEALDIVKDTLADVKVSETVQKEALAKTAELAAAVEQESKIENLIKAKGFAECVVYIEGDACNVVVRSETEGLTPAAALQITDIITSQSKVVAGKVYITPVQ